LELGEHDKTDQIYEQIGSVLEYQDILHYPQLYICSIT